MIGVITNALAIAIMAILGKFIGNRIPTRVQEQVLLVLPLSVMIMGIQMALKADEFIIVMMSLAIGTGIGAAMDIDGAFSRFGEKIDSRLAARSGGEVTGEGPMTAAIQSSILFCVGSMAIIGAIEAGMNGSTETFMIKSVLDGMTSLVFGSTLGIGVALSAIRRRPGPHVRFFGTLHQRYSARRFNLRRRHYDSRHRLRHFGNQRPESRQYAPRLCRRHPHSCRHGLFHVTRKERDSLVSLFFYGCMGFQALGDVQDALVFAAPKGEF